MNKYKTNIKKKIIIFFCIILLLIPISVSQIDNKTCLSLNTIHYVGGSGEGNYSKIQDAINNSNPEDTIFVYSGTYHEHLVVDKTLNIIGENQKNTVIHGSNSGDKPCIAIYANNVFITEFTIVWADWEYHEPGIRVYSKFVKIHNNNISYHDKGIILTPSSGNCTLSNNIFSNNHESILLWPLGSHNNILKNNVVTNNEYGIIVSNSNNNIIQNNTIDIHVWGALRLLNSNYNTIFQNTIFNNSRGIFLEDNSSNNILFHNNLKNNIHNAYDNGLNTWDFGYPSGGNYWDDYMGIDSNGDGIGDQPYRIYGGSNFDNYPFINENYWRKPPLEVIINAPKEAFINETIEFYATVTGGNPPYNYIWDFGDNQESQIQNPIHTYKNPGMYMVTLIVKDSINMKIKHAINISVYNEDFIPPIISIISPKPGLYIFDKQLLDFNQNFVLIFGGVTISFEAEDFETKIINMNIKIPNVLNESTSDSTYLYYWDKSYKGFFTIIFSVYDLGGNKIIEELNILKL